MNIKDYLENSKLGLEFQWVKYLTSFTSNIFIHRKFVMEVFEYNILRWN